MAAAPAVGDGVEVGVALQGLKNHAGAVVEVGGEHQRRVEAEAVAPVIVVIEDEGLPQCVQAVDLVKYVQFDHVVAVESPVVGWNDGFVRVLAEPDDVLARDRVDTDVGDSLPGGVNFGAWWESVDVGRVGLVIEESRIILFRDERDVEPVKDGR